MNTDSAGRLSAEAALKHPWVADEGLAPTAPLPERVLRALLAFGRHCELQKVVGRLLSKRLNEDDVTMLEEVFRHFDKNGDGQLGPDEVAAFMRHLGGDEEDAKRFALSLSLFLVPLIC